MPLLSSEKPCDLLQYPFEPGKASAAVPMPSPATGQASGLAVQPGKAVPPSSAAGMLQPQAPQGISSAGVTLPPQPTLKEQPAQTQAGGVFGGRNFSSIMQTKFMSQFVASGTAGKQLKASGCLLQGNTPSVNVSYRLTYQGISVSIAP